MTVDDDFQDDAHQDDDLQSLNDQDDDGLGSLAQSARSGHLKSARITMYIIGVITILANLFVGLSAESMVDAQFQKEIQQLNQQGLVVDQGEVERLKADAVSTTQLVAFGFGALGVVFLILGAMVHSYPVPCTVLALVLYLAGQAITGLFDPMMLVQGFIIKIIIIVALVNAIKAASAYQRDREAGLT